MKLNRVILFIALWVSTTTFAMPPQKQETAQTAPWFQGSIEDAFKISQKENKPLFLYWGAVWCPPCAEIKAEIFAKQRFAELLQLVIPVYLDGDSVLAQTWGDKLHVSGYPTLVLIAPNGKELMRFNENINFEEFESAFENAVKSGRPFSETIERALAGKATAQEWKILSQLSWSDTASMGLKTSEVLQKRMQLVDQVPNSLVAEKAQLAGNLLEAASQADDSDLAVKKILENIKTNREKYLNAMWVAPEAMIGARSTLVYMATDVIKWAYPNAQDAGRQATMHNWIAATQSLQANRNLALDNWLWAHSPELEFYKLEHAEKSVPTELRAKIQNAVKIAVAKANSHYVRHAVVSGAAELLDNAGDDAGARLLLTNELKTTDTPWYYESGLAQLAKKHDDLKTALEWSGKAARSAKGTSTRLQWMAADAMLALENAKKLNLSDDALLARVKAYYDFAMSTPDGFAGRNLSRQKRLTQLLKDVVHKEKFRTLLATEAKACKKLSNDAMKNCENHFASFAVSAKEANATVIAQYKTTDKTVHVVVSVPEGTKLNYDAPWALVLSGNIVSKGGAAAQAAVPQFDKETHSFNIAVPNAKALVPHDGLGDYTLTYFLCDTKVTWCKRAVSNGKISF